MKPHVRGTVGFGLLLGIAVQLGFLLSPGGSQAGADIGACGRSVLVRNYLEPLDRMRRLQEPPSSQMMSFAPRAIRLATNEKRLVAGGGPLGFTLENKGEKRLALDWIVETELSKVNRKGLVVRTLGRHRRRIAAMRGHSARKFLHPVSSTPAFYRIDIRFQDRDSGRMLEAFSSYARVVKERVELRMEIEKSSVLPGEYARATLVNPGTVPVEFGSWHYGYGVETFSEEEGRWRHVGNNPRILAPKLLRHTYFLQPGVKVVGCIRYLVPEGQAPGRFRFTSIGRYGSDWTEVARAGFEVAGTGGPQYEAGH